MTSFCLIVWGVLPLQNCYIVWKLRIARINLERRYHGQQGGVHLGFSVPVCQVEIGLWPRPVCVQMPNMANLGLNAVSHALPLAAAPGPLQSGGFMSGGSYHSAHGMQLQAPPQVPMPQAYAAQVRDRYTVRSRLTRCHASHPACLYRHRPFLHPMSPESALQN